MHLGRSVDQRERWQALQLHLKSARAAMEAGERGKALKHADAALALDPAYLAAQTLRERIVAMSGAPGAAATRLPAVALAEAPTIAPPLSVTPAAPTDPAAPRHQAPDLAQFEARARQRRLEKRVAAAQQGLATGRLTDVRAAIEEIKELDPLHPGLAPLVEALDAAERERVIGVLERELPLHPAGGALDLPLVIPVTPDLPLTPTAATPEPAAIPASEAANETMAVALPEILPSSPIPRVRAADDQVALEPADGTIRRSHDAQPAARGVSAAPNLTDPVVEIPVAAEERAKDNAARPRRRRSRVIPWLAAAAAFAGVLFAAPWFQRSAPSDVVEEPAPVEVAVAAPAVVPTTGVDAAAIDTPPVLDPPSSPDDAVRLDASPAVAPPVGPATNAAAGDRAASSTAAAIGTTPADSPLARSVTVAPRPLPPVVVPAPADTLASVLPAAPPAAPPQPRIEPLPSLGLSSDVPRQLAAAPIPALPAPGAARATASMAAAASVAARDDMQLVRDVLQRYRSAYQELSAERARAIWPDVNAPALQRAFQALESQTLTFDACDVQLRESSATATCRGSAEYVPKVGSREPRVEPRIWNFTLQKTGEAWQIESARTQR